MRLAFVMSGVGAACVFTVVSSRLTLHLHQSTSLEYANEQRMDNIRLMSGGELIDIAMQDAAEVVALPDIGPILKRGLQVGPNGDAPTGQQLLLDSFRDRFGG